MVLYMRPPIRIARAALPLMMLALVLGSCSKTVAPQPAMPPAANSPVHALERLTWSWNHRDAGVYAGLLTADFEFVSSSSDSTGSVGDLWTRESEVFVVGRMFDAAPSFAHFAHLDQLSVALGRRGSDLPDPRPGKDPRVHRMVVVSMTVAANGNVGLGDESLLADAPSAFYLVRGDSAVIPPDQLAAGVQPDANRWWIERWEDQGMPVRGSGATPRRLSLVDLKNYFWPRR